MNGNCEQIVIVYLWADSEPSNSVFIQSYNHVPLSESSSMKSLTEQVLIMMTDYATTSCTSMDKVWGILKRYMEEQISPISPVCELIVNFPLEINSDGESDFQRLMAAMSRTYNHHLLFLIPAFLYHPWTAFR